MKRLLAALIASLTLATGAPAPAQQADPHVIVQKMLARNPELKSFQAHIHVDARMLSFPFYAPKLDGTSYFKRPDNYQVVFTRVPPFAHGLDHFFSDLADPSTWERRFEMTVVGEPVLNGRRTIEMRLVAKVRGMIDHTNVYLDPSNYEVSEIEWHYYNGGVIAMSQYFRNEGGYSVLSAQHASISIPHVRAIADAQYTDYHTNVAVSDSVFTELHK